MPSRQADKACHEGIVGYSAYTSSYRTISSAYSPVNSSSTVTPSSLARLKARESVGSYLLFSMALIVCLETLHCFASSSWEIPRDNTTMRSVPVLAFQTMSWRLSSPVRKSETIIARSNRMSTNRNIRKEKK